MSLAFMIAVVVVVAYLLLYTAYSKQQRSLEPALLVEVLTGSKSLNHSLVELNKVAALAGVTLLLLAFFPSVLVGDFAGLSSIAGTYDALARSQTEELQQRVFWQGAVLLWAHALYSLVKYYNTKNFPALSTWAQLPTELQSRDVTDRAVAVKKVSVLVGVVGQAFLLLGWWRSASLFGVVHFYLMEIDYKWRLRVRPFAYLPFFLAAGWLGRGFLSAFG